MKLYRKDFKIYKDWITLIPTVEIHIDDMIYVDRNISISFHWLVFHARLLWLKERCSK